MQSNPTPVEGNFYDFQGELTAPTILVAEDDEEMRNVLSMVLANEGYQVVVVEDGARALSQIRRRRELQPIEAIVVDLWMPGLTGLEVAERLRHDDGDWATEIALVSGFVTDTVKYRARNLGIGEVISKPFALDELLDGVRRLVPLT